MSRRSIQMVLWVLAAGAALALSAANLFLGDLNQDEGWYLYAARLVSQGQLPYVDFATTQGPVMPFVYALAEPLVRTWGLAGGRLFTAVLGLLAGILAACTASRLARAHRAWAALTAFALVSCNVYQSYYCTMVKTYPLAACLLAAGCCCLTYAAGPRGAVAAMLAGVFMGLAGATRTSAILALPAGFLFLAGAWRVAGVLRPVWFLAGAGLALATALAPFAWAAPDALWFALWEYHAGRQPGNLVALLAYKAGFFSRQMQSYSAAMVLFLGGLVWTGLKRASAGRPVDAGENPWYARPAMACWLAALFITGAHALAPFPYDDYQVFVYPVFAAALAAWLVGLAGGTGPAVETDATAGRTVTAVATLAVLVSLVTAVSSPINQEWFVGKRDRIWWPLKAELPLFKLQRTAALVASVTAPGDLLLTQDPYLAVEANRRLPRGLELGQFSYFPDWPRDKAERCHVLNAAMLREMLRTSRAPLAAFSGYGLAIRSPSVTRVSDEERAELFALVSARYSLFREIPDFGQASTLLQIFLLAE